MAKSRTSFRKGQSGNPGGRPKGIIGFREKLADLDGRAHERLKDALEDGDPKVYLDAVKHIHAYLYGKPAQAVELTGKDGQPIESRSEVKSERATANNLGEVLRVLAIAGAFPQAGPTAEAGTPPDAPEDEVLGTQPTPDPAGIPPP